MFWVLEEIYSDYDKLRSIIYICNNYILFLYMYINYISMHKTMFLYIFFMEKNYGVNKSLISFMLV